MRYRLTAILLLLTVAVYAQENHLSIDADFLTRGEIRSGGFAPSKEEGVKSKDYASFVLERTLLGLSFEKKNLSAKLIAQHSGTWVKNILGKVQDLSVKYSNWLKKRLQLSYS